MRYILALVVLLFAGTASAQCVGGACSARGSMMPRLLPRMYYGQPTYQYAQPQYSQPVYEYAQPRTVYYTQPVARTVRRGWRPRMVRSW